MVFNTDGKIIKIHNDKISKNEKNYLEISKKLQSNGSVQYIKHDPFTITAFYSQLTHYDETMKTANAFIYASDNKRYLVIDSNLNITQIIISKMIKFI